MNDPPGKFDRIAYKSLNSRQKENFNFQKVSGILADSGFSTIRLSDDWQGADFIANHVSGDYFLKVQLKSRPIVDAKYENKDIWICFNYRNIWYLYPLDAFLRWALEEKGVGKTKGWEDPTDWSKLQGDYSWPSPPKDVLLWLNEYAL